MAKRRTYFRIRRIAAAELLRLHAAGHDVHAEAMEWAEATIAGIDDVGGRTPSTERQQILDWLASHAEEGQTPEQVAAGVGSTEKAMRNVLYNLRQQGQCAVAKCMGRAIYFPTDEAADKQRPRLEKMRQVAYDAKRAKNAADAKAKYQAAKSNSAGPGREEHAAPAPRRRSTKAKLDASLVEKPMFVLVQPKPVKQAPGPVQIVYPPSVKKVEVPTKKELCDRFGATDPAATVPGGFREEFQRLRAGGASS